MSYERSGDMLVERAFVWPEPWEPEPWRERELAPPRHRRQSESAMLLCLLERRFGPLDAAARERVESASLERLLEWEERLSGAERLEDVLGCSRS